MLGASLLVAAGTETTGLAHAAGHVTLRDTSGEPVPDDVAERLQLALGDDVYVAVEKGFAGTTPSSSASCSVSSASSSSSSR